jgi:hypothetical protein
MFQSRELHISCRINFDTRSLVDSIEPVGLPRRIFVAGSEELAKCGVRAVR